MAIVRNEIDRILQAAPARGVNSASAAVLLTASTSAFHVAAGGANDPTSITFTASLIALEGTVVFSCTGGTITTAGKVATLTYGNMPGSTATVTASVLANGATITSNACNVSKVLDGANGTVGTNNARVYAYQRAASAPTLMPGDVTVTFATNSITAPAALLNGWVRDIPTANGNPLYVTAISGAGTGATVNLLNANWAGAAVMATDGPGGTGTNGTNGLNAATITIYQRSASATAPAKPSADCTYTFASGALSGLNNGWAQAYPALDPAKPYMHVSIVTAISADASDTIPTTEWGTPRLQYDAAAVLAAQAAADAAQADADAANNALLDVFADNVLSRDEKPELVRKWGEIYGEHVPIGNQAESLGLSKTAYFGAVDALVAYLNAIPGGWSNTSVNSPIVRADANTAWNNYYMAKVTILNAIADKVKTDAITAASLAAALKGTALNDDPQQKNPGAWLIPSGIVIGSGTSAPGAVCAEYFYANTYIAAADATVLSARVYPIDPARTYSLTANFYAASGNNRYMWLLVEFYDAAGASIAQNGWGGNYSGYVYSGIPTPNQFSRVGGNFGADWAGRTVPANARTVKIGVIFQYTPGGTSNVPQAAQDFRLIDVTEAVKASKVAAEARAIADEAIERHNIVASDAYLSKGEKQAVILDWQSIDGSINALVASANSLGVSVTAVANGYNALGAYLSGLSEWSNPLVDTPIDPVTYKLKWKDYYVAEEALKNSIAAKIQANAAAAQTAANTANEQIAIVASNGIVDRGEKAGEIFRWTEFLNESNSLYGRGSTYGVIAERDAYSNSYNQLEAYLNGLSGFHNPAVDTPVDRPTYQARFADYLSARLVLQNAIAAKISTTSTWAGTTGAGKPEDYATVGANAGNFNATIGGDNLTPNSGFERVVGDMAIGYNVYNNGGVSEPTTPFIAPGRLGGNAQAVAWTGSNSTTKGIYGTVCKGGWQPGKTYILSFSARTTNLSGSAQCALAWNTTPAAVAILANPALATVWQRYVFRLLWGGSVEADGFAFLSATAVAGGGNIHFDELMVVEGDISSSYYPSTAEAQSTADAATAAVNAIFSDGVLDRSEKVEIVRRMEEKGSEYAPLIAQADAVGVSRTAYVNANALLNDYVFALSPQYTDFSQNTTIDRATADLKWNNYYSARAALQIAIGNKIRSDAATDATNKANSAQANAIETARVAAVARVYEAEVRANVYADGIVTEEEQRAINDATAKANAAQTNATNAAALDATSKANVAATMANQDGIITAPLGGLRVSNVAGEQGAIKIRLPQSWTNTMMKFTVDIYEYLDGYSCSLEIGGYTYGDNGGAWYNTTARVLGGSNVEYPVYFGHDGTKCCVWIGRDGTQEAWTYPQIRVRDVLLGYTGYAASTWASGWQISIDSGLHSNHAITSTVLDTLPGADWAKIPDRAGRPAPYATNGAPTGSLVAGVEASIVATGAQNGTAALAPLAASISGIYGVETAGNTNTSSYILIDTQTAAASGGVGPYTYSFVMQASGSLRIRSVSGATVSIEAKGSNIQPSGTLTCTAVDSRGRVIIVTAYFAVGFGTGVPA